MSYPKRHPANAKDTDRSGKLSQKKEQLKTLLINKFRGKYQSVIMGNDHYEQVLRDEVETFLIKGTMNEADLLKLDRKFAALFGASNGNMMGANASGSAFNQSRKYQTNGGERDKQQTIDKEAGSSNYAARNGFNHSQVRPSADTQRQDKESRGLRSRSNVIKEAGASVLNKSTVDGDYWNMIIMANVDSFNKEQEDAKLRQKENQVRMKQELSQQVQLQKQLKDQERQKERDYMDKIRVKAEEDERLLKSKQDAIKRKLQEEKLVRDMQLQEISNKKTEESKMEKIIEEQRRKQMQQEAEQEKLKEKQKMEQYKYQCKNSIEENKRQKDIQKQKDDEDSRKVPDGQDLLGQLFQQKKNISLELRHKNDQAIELMKDKLASTDKRGQLIETTAERMQRERMERLAVEEAKQRQLKKQKEIETKQYLDLQMQEKAQRSKLDKLQDNTEAKYIQKDVQDYQEQERKRKEERNKVKQVHKSNLEVQIESKQGKSKGMDPKEYQLNKSLIEQIANKDESPQKIIRKPF